jgi:hypothetical protein
VTRRVFWAAPLVLMTVASGLPAEEPPPAFLGDRGGGVATSIFGTYVRKGELLVYPFYEYVRSSEDEYHGAELGFVGEIDYLGESREHEAVLFLAYGLTENLAVELEGELFVSKTLERAPDDTTTGMPERLEESGLGEIEAQVRWRFSEETETRPELFSNFEVKFPTTSDNVLIGARDWAVAVGFGADKGFRWGTLTSRLSVGYEGEEEEFALGEYAIEYLKRLSQSWVAYSAIEGEDDELSLLLGAQWQLGPHLYWKMSTGVGLTPKADDFAPEVGLLLSF